VITAKVGCCLGSFSAWGQCRYGNLWYGSRFHWNGTCSIGVLVCMGPSLARDFCSKLHLAGCFGEISGRKSQGLFGAEALCNFCSSSLMLCRHQGRCCAPASGSCGCCRHSALLGLHLGLPLSDVVQACGSVESQIC
jgi:hypothetical protein